jgi:hypothetical protein
MQPLQYLYTVLLLIYQQLLSSQIQKRNVVELRHSVKIMGYCAERTGATMSKTPKMVQL